MIAFVFDRRSLFLLAGGAVFLGLVLVAIGFLLGVQYGVLPPGAAQSTLAQATGPALPVRLTGFADPPTAADSADSDAEPAEDPGWNEGDAVPVTGDGVAEPSDRYDPEPLPDGNYAPEDSSPVESVPFSAAPPAPVARPTPAKPAAVSKPEPESDPIIDSRGGVPVALPPSVPSTRGGEEAPPAKSAAQDAPTAPAAATAASAEVESTTPEPGRYAVQAGAYRERLNCDAMVQKLSARGFSPYVVEIVRAGQSPLYAVRVGRFPDRASAAKVATKMHSQAGVAVVVLSIG